MSTRIGGSRTFWDRPPPRFKVVWGSEAPQLFNVTILLPMGVLWREIAGREAQTREAQTTFHMLILAPRRGPTFGLRTHCEVSLWTLETVTSVDVKSIIRGLKGDPPGSGYRLCSGFPSEIIR